MSGAPTDERRKKARNWIDTCTEAILGRMKAVGRRAHDAARRQAVETWLLDHRIVERVQPVKASLQVPRTWYQMWPGDTPFGALMGNRSAHFPIVVPR